MTDENTIPVEDNTGKPNEVKLEAFDMRSLQYVSEKQQRIVAEERRLAYEKIEADRENGEIIGEIQKKYGVNLTEYSIMPREGVLRRR